MQQRGDQYVFIFFMRKAAKIFGDPYGMHGIRSLIVVTKSAVVLLARIGQGAGIAISSLNRRSHTCHDNWKQRGGNLAILKVSSDCEFHNYSNAMHDLFPDRSCI